MEAPGADSEEKRVLASDVDPVMVDSLKALDPNRPIREADILIPLANARFRGNIGHRSNIPNVCSWTQS
jgi:hypothetical protein